MRKTVSMSLAVVLVGGSALYGQLRNAKGPMERLTEGVYLIGQGTYDGALEHLLWCFDQGAIVDAEFKPVRETSVIDALAFLAEAHPPTIQALKARRDTALAQAGSPPKISPAFFDVLALNRALGDDAASDELIQKAVSAGSIQKFGTNNDAPPSLKSALTAKSSASYADFPEAKIVASRSKALFQIAKLQPRANLKAQISEAKRLNAAEGITLAAKAQQLNKELATLKRASTGGSPEDAKMVDMQLKRLQQIQKSLFETQAMYKAESDYLIELTTWNDTRSTD